jgi:fibrillarin-like pre-rRNA processing protein
VAALNKRFLRADGRLLAAIKARSEDVTADPEEVFEDVQAELGETFEILATERLEPYHEDHLGVVARPRE